MTLILASESPRRRELLGLMGIPHEVRRSGFDEDSIRATHPRTFAIQAAYAKANAIASQCADGQWVLAADTVVTCDGIIYQKPADAAGARAMLEGLSGRPHDVITALVLAQAGGMKAYTQAERTAVVFRALSPADIDAYIATGEPFDKAGGYGIQGHGGALVDHIEGDYYNVVGLPCRLLAQMLEEAGIDIPVTIPAPPDRWRNGAGSGR